MLLIQIGGLGLMTFFALALTSFRQKISYRFKFVLGSAFSWSSLGKLNDFIKAIFTYTFIFEGIGALLLSLHFIPERGFVKGLGTSIFLAVSAFCNAGFDPFSNQSMMAYNDNLLINGTLATLIIFGGLGFGVWLDLNHNIKNKKAGRNHKIWKHLSPHSKLAISATIFLILLGTVVILFLEKGKVAGMEGSWLTQITMALFQSVTMRTAGFATVDYRLAHPASILVWSYLMMVGGSPGGTAGGLKTTSWAVILIYVYQNLQGKKESSFDYHRINPDAIRSALTLAFIYASVFVSGVVLITIFDPDQSVLYIIFETISALATVGVSANLTPILSQASQIVLMLLMFTGRIGPLTLITSLQSYKQQTPSKTIRYQDTDILIG